MTVKKDWHGVRIHIRTVFISLYSLQQGNHNETALPISIVNILTTEEENHKDENNYIVPQKSPCIIYGSLLSAGSYINRHLQLELNHTYDTTSNGFDCRGHLLVIKMLSKFT